MFLKRIIARPAELRSRRSRQSELELNPVQDGILNEIELNLGIHLQLLSGSSVTTQLLKWNWAQAPAYTKFHAEPEDSRIVK